MNIKDINFYRIMREFLTIYLPKQKCYSPNTVKSYRLALNLFIGFLGSEKNIPLSKLSFGCFNSENVTDFLDWIQKKDIVLRQQETSVSWHSDPFQNMPDCRMLKIFL
jgi:site-specific recombinase XerD